MREDLLHCANCGEEARDHHEFVRPRIQLPEECQCDPNGWTRGRHPICEEYKDSKPADGMCRDCEHEPGCHKATV